MAISHGSFDLSELLKRFLWSEMGSDPMVLKAVKTFPPIRVADGRGAVK